MGATIVGGLTRAVRALMMTDMGVAPLDTAHAIPIPMTTMILTSPTAGMAVGLLMGRRRTIVRSSPCFRKLSLLIYLSILQLVVRERDWRPPVIPLRSGDRRRLPRRLGRLFSLTS